jgi:CheY-like chemotaxis protein
MPIVTREDRYETVLAVHDGFDANDADELHDVLLRIERDRAVTIDLREVRRIEDFVIARLAQEFAHRPVRVLGLCEHQRRILRYFAPESAAEAHEQRGSSPEDDCRLASAGGGAPVVLVVGDDADFRTMLSEFVAAEGYEVREAANLAGAMRHITGARPTIVLLDCAMSSAPMVLEWLRRDGIAAGVPVVVISDAERPPQGAVASLHEPVERGSLAATLKSLRETPVDASPPGPPSNRGVPG